MKITNSKDFMKNYNLKDNTMNESDLQRICNYLVYPRDSEIFSDKGFNNIDKGRLGGIH